MDDRNLYNSGLCRSDWYLLRDAILCAAGGSESPSREYDKLPQYLKEHQIGRIVSAALAGKETDLTKAMELMVPGSDCPYLILAKW
jgi:hypothetical protein